MELAPEWTVEADQLRREWKFKNFRLALAWVNQVAVVAEELKHHPDVSFGWGYVRLTITTHDIGGKLSEKDFDLAKRIDQLV